jgi:hypothetical protein
VRYGLAVVKVRRCRPHCTGNGFISAASVVSAGCPPSRIASTISGASSVSLMTRPTWNSTMAISAMVACVPFPSISRRATVRTSLLFLQEGRKTRIFTLVRGSSGESRLMQVPVRM